MCAEWLSPEALPGFLVCGACGALRECPEVGSVSVRQLCSCERRGLREARGRPLPKWPGYDFNLRAELCRLCAATVLRSGHRYHVWFCSPCLAAVRAANDRAGEYVVPVGRHSLHAGRLINPRVPARRLARQVEGLAESIRTAGARTDALEGWRAELVTRNMREAGLDSPAALADYLAINCVVVDDPDRLVGRLLNVLAL